MRILLSLVLLLALTSPALADIAPQPPEEIILVRSFADYVVALQYDEACNGTDPQARSDFGKPENVNLAGNRQMLAARLGAVWHSQNPEHPVEMNAEYLRGLQEKVETYFKQVLDEQGCESEEAQSAAEAYRLYSTTPPAAMSTLIDERITEAGGTITPPEQGDAAGQ